MFHGRLVLCCFVLSLACVSVAGAYVGVTDGCPLPTPYPPASAGAGIVYNAGMEGGFTNGVANQWTSFKMNGLPGQIFYAGNDRSSAGSYSQKLDMPQPTVTSSEQYAGIYQRMWVVPGATYTASAKVYMVFGAETYEGEDLVAQFGLDPFGQDSGTGSGMVWASRIGTKNQWVTVSVTAVAQLPVMTISMAGIRKFAQHGSGALVWFDAVTFSGPVPTGTRPGPEPDPVSPETLIPPAAAANLVTNPSFETFTGSVAANWNSWFTSGSGTWKRSRRVGKVGGAYYGCSDPYQPLGQMNGKTALLMGGTPSASNPNDPGSDGSYGLALSLVNSFPEMEDAIIVGRPYVDPNDSTYLSNPTFYGTQLANQMYMKQQAIPRIDCWQGLNEPDTGGKWQQVVAFEKAFADRAHQLGMKTVALNLSTGSPGNMWREVDESFNPSCHDLYDVADYLGHHVYGGPGDDLAVTNQVTENVCDFAMRPRRFKDMYDRRGWRFPPVIATEGNSWGGKTAQWGDTRMSADLTAMGDYMNYNDWWCGYTHFIVGGCGWDSFEIADRPAIIQAVADWNYNHPSDAKNGLYSQMFGAGKVHPKTSGEAVPAGTFNGGINQQITGLTAGTAYLVKCWMKYEFRGNQPQQLKFYLGVDPTGQTSNGSAATIDWGTDQIAGKAPVHEIFTHVWRTFTATGTTASLWLRANHPVANPSFMVYADQVEVRRLDAQQTVPVIELSTNTITPSAAYRTSPPSSMFSVRSANSLPMNYTIIENCGWLSVQPTSGSSTGEFDYITIAYDTANLPIGTYTCTITVASPTAANSPQTIAVELSILVAQADFDRDGDVDQDDFGHLQHCMTGGNVEVTDPACVDAKLDGDVDIDESDVNTFLSCFAGPGIAPAGSCIVQP